MEQKIIDLLKSKPHDTRNLDRYINFIRSCQDKNSNDGPKEKHHICPKSIFSEYKNLKKNSWNCILMTPREHFIAHLLLYKAYSTIKSMTSCFWMMSNFSGTKINSRLYQNLRTKFIKNTNIGKFNKKKINVFMHDGKIKKISTDDPRYLSGELKPIFANTTTVIDASGQKYRVNITDSRYLSGELVGHTKGMTFALDNNGQKHYVCSNDYRFKTGELIGNNKGTIYINNGKKSKRINPNSNIPFGWKLGRIMKTSQGFVWINDGQSTKMVPKDKIPHGWKLGRSISI